MKLTQGKMLDIPVPVPPVAEQKHIVTKVDQLMALCDDLEAKQTKKRALATQSTRSALVALTTAENADDLAAAWRRIQTRFENFVSRPDDVALLRQACIELAVRGRLAGNLPSDGSGQDLLRKIREENQKAGKAKNPRQGEANVTEAAQPFQIPSHWVWVCWRDLFQSSEAGWSPQCASRPRVGDEWGVLKVSAVSWDRFDPDENKALLPGVEPRRDCAVQAGDFLMSRANTAALVGRSVVVAQQPTRLLMSDKTIRCHFSPLVDRSFMNYYNRTETARQHYIANASGTSDSMKNISRDVILDIPAPLPPLAEQKRIVAKVDHLMSLLDDLEAKLRKQEDAATRLAESLAAAVAA
jgi:type I restriction enzyme S subunit